MKSIIFPAGTRCVPYADIAHLMADALWPETGPDDERLDYAFSRVNLDDEIRNAVTNGELLVRNPLTFGPHAYPIGNALQTAVVAIDDLRAFVAERGLAVEFDAKVGRAASACAGRRNPPETENAINETEETPKERRHRWLAFIEHEKKQGRARGALARLSKSEGVDRSNMGKAIAKAREERADERRSGEWTSQLMSAGKR